jgi:acyl-CoA thioesterase-1
MPSGGYLGCAALVNRVRRLVAAVALALMLFPAAGAAWAEATILAFGDSLTAGFGLPVEEGFTAQLAARLKADGVAARVVNAGISGDTSAGGLARLDWTLETPCDLVLLELGANDALRGIDPALTDKNLNAILARLAERKLKVLLIGMKAPSNWGPDFQRRFDAIYPDLARKWQVPLYPFFLEEVALDPALNQPDGLHPNAQGVAKIVAALAPQVERVLAAP